MCPGKTMVESLIESNRRLLEKVEGLEQELSRARHLACHDALTGLPNRTLMLDRLAQAMSQAIRQRKAVGVLLLDLDGFKDVNDRFGHDAGDLLLQRVAARLASCIRECDTACRYGGDEFVILLPEVDGAEDVEAVSRKIRACLAEPHLLGGEHLVVHASIGAALFQEGRLNCNELIGMADAAMYRAKRAISLQRAGGTG
jgi:diguanylate cyclase (GGDEF)-like protein